MSSESIGRARVSRRAALQLLASGTGLALLAACGQQAPAPVPGAPATTAPATTAPAPKPAEASKPAEAPKPAEAAKPTEAAKPAAPPAAGQAAAKPAGLPKSGGTLR